MVQGGGPLAFLEFRDLVTEWLAPTRTESLGGLFGICGLYVQLRAFGSSRLHGVGSTWLLLLGLHGQGGRGTGCRVYGVSCNYSQETEVSLDCS